MRQAVATASAVSWAPARVWLKYCVASSGLAMIVAEQSTKAFSPPHVTRLTTNFSLRCDESVVETLMIALGMIVTNGVSFLHTR